MALEKDLTDDDDFFTGEDKTLRFAITDVAGAPIDVSAWTLEWSLRLKPGDADPPVLKKTSAPTDGITVSGTFDSDPNVNTQRVLVAIAKADTASIDAGDARGAATRRTFAYALKRTDDGSGTVLTFGTLAMRKVATH